ncbi:uncharacterized protein LOC129590011 [Paramacrobiotus metropolitanus]|uniref:uncharacterized protein LOC129590011 n=1 Tax=Paramacrobiotus metropolitanus TaxID=2943436 RepID=UPI0024463DD5|nr:uncharacterized protein LOC129590011 [Paramacrobiotus metropolitanus]XP_055340942.1 uncharacterized protein LOC129590011 [Paramacrobiotus metropolitanus]XP_055340943.1 uncharacterized protein LOC129590011 [Paramacrobiotus metropolitanus]XP_055340945.1 uncharacterized protein LOC129590011 [Paramacrobiotus metropolitanus]XP_055340946.1 uncharacterized protein LOC129590011 [Paramacrobiotus metropolitanus]XP_055340947.1 uncharacterized protein LOC129590011 [Paramacrobiotus metropolitanus]XP_05
MTMEWWAPFVMPQFQSLLADANQMNYQNTVAVHNDDDSWWLGYIQDIDGDQVFIHFNARKVTDRWVPMGSVWPLLFYWDDRSQPYSAGMPIYAALRDEDDGPFRFRPVTMLGRFRGCEKMCEVFYVQTTIAVANGNQDIVRGELVQNCQISKQLPPPGSPLLHPSSSRLLCTKYVVPFPRAHAVLSDASDKFRIVMHFRQAFQNPPPLGRLRFACCDLHSSGQFAIGKQFRQAAQQNRTFYILSDNCRFHLRTERDVCMFIVMSPAMDDEMAQHMIATLTEVLETHLASRACFPPILSRILPIIDVSMHDPDAESDSSCTLASLCHLPPFLLSQIFPHMDIHSQMRAKRVCALWQLLLSSPRLTEHFSIALDSCGGIHSDNNNCFRAASLLSRTVSTTTRSLTVLGDFLPHNLLFLYDVLIAMRITLPFIVFKDHIITDPGWMGCLDPTRLMHSATDVTSFYRDVCDFIFLCNWKVRNLFGKLIWYVFKYGFYDRGPLHPLPAHEQAFMTNLTKESHELPIDQLYITIPRLLLRCDDSEMHMTSRVMHALSDNFPPVTADMIEKVRAVYARWVRTLSYPDDWQPIRYFLLLFSPFELDGRPQRWSKVDLRLVDVSTISRTAIYGIYAVFQA